MKVQIFSIAVFITVALATPPYYGKPPYTHGYHYPAPPPPPSHPIPGDGKKGPQYVHGHKYHYKKIVQCPDLPPPDYGKVQITGGYSHQKAVYDCNDGYILIGTKTRKCLADGRWTGVQPECKPVDCGPLRKITNGQVSVSGTTLGSIATYSCDKYFKLVGKDIRKCLPSGDWSGKEPQCVLDHYRPPPPKYPYYKKIPCPPLPSPDNGYVQVGYPSKKDPHAGLTAIYHCKPGHVLVGEKTRQCDHRYGKWTREAPICRRINCGPLPHIANGAVSIAPDTRLGSTATYSCRRGFTLSGNVTRECLSNGEWSRNEPTCIPIDCGGLDDPENGVVQISPDTKLGGEAVYKCDFGYKLDGIRKRFCRSDAQWTSEEPSCVEISCGQPPSSDPNGKVIINGTKLLDEAEYTCNVGYFLRGSSTIYCRQDGRWSDRAPVCRPVNCGAPDPADPNGFLRFRGSTTLGQEVLYSCNSGYELVGENTAVCQANGKWSNDAPTCRPIDCGVLPAPKEGRVSFYPGTTLSSTATFICRKGLRLVGSAKRVCQANKEWSGTQPICTKYICPKISPPRYGKIYVSGYHPGDYVIIKCGYGFKLVGGKPHLKCLPNGYWSGLPGKCIKDPSYYHKKYHHYE